jgi:hypothetical protein
MDAVVRLSIRGTVFALFVLVGWAIGSAMGAFVVFLIPPPDPADLMSPAILVAVAGSLLGTLGGIVVGWRQADRITDRQRERRALVWIVVAVLAIAFVGVPAGKAFCLVDGPDRFESGAWQRDDGGWPCGDRSGMVDDLVDEVLEPGMGMNEVVAILGEPLVAPAITTGMRDRVWKVACQIDCLWLVITFDGGDALSEAALRSD